MRAGNYPEYFREMKKRAGQTLFILPVLFSCILVLLSSSPAIAALTDPATDWNNFGPPNGYDAPYTHLGQPISDHETSSDPTNGGAAVSPADIDLASASPGAPPGTEDTPSYGYYNGSTEYDPLDPSTLEDDYLLFRMRIGGDPTQGGAFSAYHWNILLDIDNDGYKEYWIDLEGSYQSGGTKADRVQILYNNDNTQQVADPDAARVEQFEARYNDDLTTYPNNHTRLLAVGDGSGDYWIEIQVPLTALNDGSGNQVVFPDSPVGFVYSTSASNSNPLQKDWMMDLDFLSLNDPITFGDVVILNGEPKLEFVDSSLQEVSFYTVGDNIFTYVKYPSGNTTSGIDSITVTVTNPRTGDDEQLTLYESGPDSGLFTNNGGATKPISDDASTGWISFVKTSSTTESASWTLTYQNSSGTWLISDGSTSHTAVTAGTEYTSDNGEVTFTLYENSSPADGDQITFTTSPANPLLSVIDDGIYNNSDNDHTTGGGLEVASGDTIQFSYTTPSSDTYTTQTNIVGSGEPFIQFTRASGLPSTDFQLTSNPATSDKLYVTVNHPASNTDPTTVQTIQVALTGTAGDSQTINLTETGPDTGIFRNTTGLSTKVSDGTITPNDSLWEDLDGGVVTAEFEYPAGSTIYYETTATLFYINGAGRVYFTNSAGTQDVDLYAAGQSVYLQVVDPNYFDCTGASEPITVTLCVPDSPGSTTCDSGKDSETVDLYETSSGSGKFMNNIGSGTAITTATSDGSPTTGNTVLELSHDDTVIVKYTDCDDGDSETSNDIKTDTAAYNAPPIVINEVFFYPDITQPYQTEYFQVYNSSSSPVNIYGYTVTDGDSFTYSFPQDPDPSVTNPDEFWLDPGEVAYVFLYDTDLSYHNELDGTTYYLYTNGGGFPSDQFGDPDNDLADQLLLYDESGTIIDYVGWSFITLPPVDYLSDDSPAVTQAIWQDDAYKAVFDDPMTILVDEDIQAGEAITRISIGFDTDVPSDWVYTSTSSIWDPDNRPILTPVTISSFAAFENYGRVLLRWETAYENGTVGFYIYRKGKDGSSYEPVNKRIVPALITEPQGGTYQLYDKGAVPGRSYTYLLEEVVTNGERLEYGPFEVSAVAVIPGFNLLEDFSRNIRNVSNASQKRDETRRRTSRNQKKSPSNQTQPFQGKSSQSYGGKPDALQISILNTGLYFISAEEIGTHFNTRPANVSKLIKKYGLSLETQGRAVPYFSDERNSGIYFYGLEYNDIFTRDNIYWLTMQAGQEMEQGTLAGTNSRIPDQSFTENLHVEEDYWPALAQPWENTEDYWIWDYAFSGVPELSQLAFSFNIEGMHSASRNAILTVNFVGGSVEGGGADHLAEVSINDSWIGNCSWKGMDFFPCELSFPQSLLNEGENALQIYGVLVGDADFSLFYVDSFDVQYQRYYEAVDNSLHFQGDENRVVGINGFDGSRIYLLNVSDPYESKLLVDKKQKRNNSSSRLDFIPENSGAQYFAASQSAIKQVADIRPYNFIDLKNRRNRGQYLVITPAELSGSAQELADYRSGQGFTTKVVHLRDIFAEFNHGLYSPYAIKEFLAYAFNEWSMPPEYVVLIGDATYDYRDLMGYGGNMLPTIFVSTPHGLFASDNDLADVDNDGIPDMAIGRLPVLSEEEFTNIFNKIKDYEHKTGGWKDKVILLADKGDDKVNFTSDSERVSLLMPADYSLEKIYLTDYSLVNARQRLFNALGEGAAFVNFFGHAGIDQITQQGLLHSDDIDGLSTNGGAPVITAMTCAVGQFTFPFLDTLAELMVLQPSGGATAIWSASSLSENSEARLLDSFFYSALNRDSETRLGNIINKAFREYALKGNKPYHILIYNLLGDPALIVR